MAVDAMTTTIAAPPIADHGVIPEPSASEQEQDAGDDEPDGGVGPQQCQGRERRDPEHRACDVDRVRLQRWHRPKQRAEWQRQGRDESRDQHDEQRQDDEVGVRTGRLLEPEEELVRVASLDVQLRAVHQQDGHEQQDREGRDRQTDAAPAEQDAHADAEEARHQQEVAEEPDVTDVRGDPPDQQQLDEQDRGAGQEKANRSAGERPERGDRASRIREGSWHVATVAARCVMAPLAFRSTRGRRTY